MNECYNIVVVVKVAISDKRLAIGLSFSAGLGLEKPNLGLDPGETSALAISIAPRSFKFREIWVSISTRTFVFSIHSFALARN